MARLSIELALGGLPHAVQVERDQDTYTVVLDGVRCVADVQRIENSYFSILIDGTAYELWVEEQRGGYRVARGSNERTVELVDPATRARPARERASGPEEVVAAMPGRVVRVLVEDGQAVETGQGLVVLEAMKMENEITAGRTGRVRRLSVQPGQTVEGGALLLMIE